MRKTSSQFQFHNDQALITIKLKQISWQEDHKLSQCNMHNSNSPKCHILPQCNMLSQHFLIQCSTLQWPLLRQHLPTMAAMEQDSETPLPKVRKGVETTSHSPPSTPSQLTHSHRTLTESSLCSNQYKHAHGRRSPQGNSSFFLKK